MTNPEPEDAYDRLADALGLTAARAHPGLHYPVPVENDAPEVEAADTSESAPTAEWSADRNRLILTSPTTFEGSTQSFAGRTQSFTLNPIRSTVRRIRQLQDDDQLTEEQRAVRDRGRQSVSRLMASGAFSLAPQRF